MRICGQCQIIYVVLDSRLGRTFFSKYTGIVIEHKLK
jgi:hypothetical protein